MQLSGAGNPAKPGGATGAFLLAFFWRDKVVRVGREGNLSAVRALASKIRQWFAQPRRGVAPSLHPASGQHRRRCTNRPDGCGRDDATRSRSGSTSRPTPVFLRLPELAGLRHRRAVVSISVRNSATPSIFQRADVDDRRPPVGRSGAACAAPVSIAHRAATAAARIDVAAVDGDEIGDLDDTLLDRLQVVAGVRQLDEREMSTMPATVVSLCPTPTVSTRSRRSRPLRRPASLPRVFSATPPSEPADGLRRMKASSRWHRDSMRVLSPRMDPGDRGRGSTTAGPAWPRVDQVIAERFDKGRLAGTRHARNADANPRCRYAARRAHDLLARLMIVARRFDQRDRLVASARRCLAMTPSTSCWSAASSAPAVEILQLPF